MSIFETYSHLSDLYLKFAVEGYEKDRPYESLEDCRRYCDQLKAKLHGMLALMHGCGAIDQEGYDLEMARIAEGFKSSQVYQANKSLFGQ